MIVADQQGWASKSFRTIPLNNVATESKLKKVLTYLDIVSFGISATLGSGVFVSIGYISTYYTGPSLFLCFIVVICAVMLSALCFAEFSSKVNMSGMGYSYTYATYGELVAFCTGILTFLSYCLGNAAVARGWAEYLRCFIHALCDVEIPEILTSLPLNDWISLSVLAPTLCGASALLALSGMKESASVAKILVILNLSIMLTFVCYGLGSYGDMDNLTPFVLPNVGWIGVLRGSGLAFFCMIGWDLMCSMTEEMKDPVRDLPRGIITAVAVVGVIYCGVSITLSAMVPTALIDERAPIATAFLIHGDWNMYLLVSFVATSICMANVLTGAIGPPRVLYTMANDGLLFKNLTTVCTRAGIPRNATILCGSLNVLMSGLFNFHQLASLTSCFSLIVYILVCGGVLLLRNTNSRFLLVNIFLFIITSVLFQLELFEEGDWGTPFGVANGMAAIVLWAAFRSVESPLVFETNLCDSLLEDKTSSACFQAPWVPLVPILAMWINSFMLASLGRVAVGWSLLVVLGCAALYLCYGAQHSRLNSL